MCKAVGHNEFNQHNVSSKLVHFGINSCTSTAQAIQQLPLPLGCPSPLPPHSVTGPPCWARWLVETARDADTPGATHDSAVGNAVGATGRKRTT